MLLTGFDAPIEQVMYLDSPLKEHTLLQAIARVNRTAERKTYGLVVDYWGVSEALREALAIFAPSMDMMLPDPRAVPFIRDLKWLGEIRQGAKARFRDANLDVSDCGEKVR